VKAMLDVDELVFSPPELGGVLYLPGPSGGGSKIYDRSPYGNTGNIIGATWTGLPSGLWCLDFDGTDDFVNCGNHSSLAALTQISIIFWFKLNTLKQSRPISKWSAGKQEWIVQFPSTAPDELSFGFYGSNDQTSKLNYSTSNGWVFIAGVWSGGTSVEVFKNGEHLETLTVSPGAVQDLGENVVLGRHPTAAEWLLGSLALVRVINIPLSKLTIKSLFDQEKHLFGVW
jgi:hypothetical protein